MRIYLGILALAILSCKNDAPQVGTTKTTQEEKAEASNSSQKHNHQYHWAYEQVIHESEWDTKWEDCGTEAATHRQSPRDILTETSKIKSHIDSNASNNTPEGKPDVIQNINYYRDQFNIVHNGHTIQFNPINSKGYPHTLIADKEYKLLQFHIHTPSEHTLNGDSYDAEVHFVHEATEWQSEKDITKKKLLVLGFLLKATDSLKDEKQQQVRALIQKVGDLNLRTKTGSIEVGHEVKAIPVTTLETYQYPGSLTTPPCSNNVEWHIAQSHVEITNQELEKLRHSIGLNNNRKISKRTTIIKG